MGCGSSAQPVEDRKCEDQDSNSGPNKPTADPDASAAGSPPSVPLSNPPAIDSPGAHRSSGTTHELLPDDQAFDPVPAPDLGFAVNEEDEYKCIDMDAPRSSKAFVSQPQSPFSTTTEKLPVGAQSKRRFRKRSVNLHPLPDHMLATVRNSFDAIDTEGTGAPQL